MGYPVRHVPMVRRCGGCRHPPRRGGGRASSLRTGRAAAARHRRHLRTGVRQLSRSRRQRRLGAEPARRHLGARRQRRGDRRQHQERVAGHAHAAVRRDAERAGHPRDGDLHPRAARTRRQQPALADRAAAAADRRRDLRAARVPRRDGRRGPAEPLGRRDPAGRGAARARALRAAAHLPQRRRRAADHRPAAGLGASGRRPDGCRAASRLREDRLALPGVQRNRRGGAGRVDDAHHPRPHQGRRPHRAADALPGPAGSLLAGQYALRLALLLRQGQVPLLLDRRPRPPRHAAGPEEPLRQDPSRPATTARRRRTTRSSTRPAR